jgi:hypothetical protein
MVILVIKRFHILSLLTICWTVILQCRIDWYFALRSQTNTRKVFVCLLRSGIPRKPMLRGTCGLWNGNRRAPTSNQPEVVSQGVIALLSDPIHEVIYMYYWIRWQQGHSRKRVYLFVQWQLNYKLGKARSSCARIYFVLRNGSNDGLIDWIGTHSYIRVLRAFLAVGRQQSTLRRGVYRTTI